VNHENAGNVWKATLECKGENVRKICLSTFLVLGLVAAVAHAAEPAADQVVGFRGDGTGIFPAANPPTTWNEEKKEGIVWKVNVGATLHSSPVISADKIFLLVESDKLVCLDAKSGKELWAKTTGVQDLKEQAEPLAGRDEVGNTTPTPVTDGKQVYVVFANGIVTAFDLEGNRKWAVFINEVSQTGYGRTASPCIADGKLIVSMGYLAGLDCANGKVLWKAQKALESFGSPIPVKVGGVPLVVSPTGHVLKASDGTLWGQTKDTLTYASPAIAGDRAYFMDRDTAGVELGNMAGAVKRVWRGELEGEFFASPAVHDGLIYMISNQGELTVTDAKDGTLVYKKELEIGNMSGKPTMMVANIYASVCIAGKYVYVGNEKGETVVFETGREYKQVAVNRLKDETAGTMTFAGNRIFIRGKETLYCIGK
jgi:outer membrane protein assembly factor BamB